MYQKEYNVVRCKKGGRGLEYVLWNTVPLTLDGESIYKKIPSSDITCIVPCAK